MRTLLRNVCLAARAEREYIGNQKDAYASWSQASGARNVEDCGRMRLQINVSSFLEKTTGSNESKGCCLSVKQQPKRAFISRPAPPDQMLYSQLTQMWREEGAHPTRKAVCRTPEREEHGLLVWSVLPSYSPPIDFKETESFLSDAELSKFLENPVPDLEEEGVE